MQRLIAFLDERVSGRALGLSRIILGVAAVCKGVVTLAALHGLQSGDSVSFPYSRFDLSMPEGDLALAIGVSWLIFALFFTVGFGTRISGALLAIAIFLTIAVDQQLYSNHLYLLATMVALMSIAGAGARYSIDAWRGQVRPTVPRWAVTLIMLQLTSVYLFAALSKLNEGFLSGAVMERAFEPAMRDQIERFIALDTLAMMAIATELFLAFAFWSAWGRWIALPAAVGFHAANVVIMDRSGAVNFAVFALIMLSMMIVYFTDTQPVEEPSPEAGEPRRADAVAAAPG